MSSKCCCSSRRFKTQPQDAANPRGRGEQRLSNPRSATTNVSTSRRDGPGSQLGAAVELEEGPPFRHQECCTAASSSALRQWGQVDSKLTAKPSLRNWIRDVSYFALVSFPCTTSPQPFCAPLFCFHWAHVIADCVEPPERGPQVCG